MKLHLGCGKRFIPGYIHIDIDKFDHIDYIHDISKLPIITNSSVEEIYTCGSFAYFDRQEAKLVLNEWNRVLIPGGILRIAVTNFEACVKIYQASGLDARGILGPIFGRWNINDNQFIYQKTVYDFQSIKKLLESNNFQDTKIFDPYKVLPVGYDDASMAYIPHMDRNGLLISLNVECNKP